MAESDGEDYVYYGTPLEDEKAPVRGFYKAPQDPSKTRALPVWEQEVTDEDGRKRFHGAFTGGYSAGFYNSVGSKEGFVPGSFKTSRSDRAKFDKQSVEDFMDADELAEKKKTVLHTKDEYDTFATGQAEKARKQAELESKSHASLIPGPVIKEFIQPVPTSIGVTLLKKMGWRQGKGLAAVNPAEMQSSLWGPEAMLLSQNVEIHVLKPKSDFHGLGYDPFKNAEVFRKAKSTDPKNKSLKRNHGVAFGVGILEETDQFGEIEDYVVEASGPKGGQFNFEIASDESDEDLSTNKHLTNQSFGPRGQSILHLESSRPSYGLKSFIPGFEQSSTCVQVIKYPPPEVPPGFDVTISFDHKSNELFPVDSPPSTEPPSDPELLKAINTLASYVARNGPAFEAVAVEKHAKDPRFGFLFGGDGADYYKWKVLDQKVKFSKLSTAVNPAQRPKPLEADERGRLLGEEALPKTSEVQQGGKDASASQKSAQRIGSRPYLDNIAESDRKMLQDVLKGNFVRASTQELIVGDTTKGGLRLPNLQPKEEKVQESKSLSSLPKDKADGKPITRYLEEWRPSPLLCKRFGLPDPFHGKEGSECKRPEFQTYQLNLPDTLGVKEKHTEKVQDGKATEDASNGVQPADKPMDLFRAIFEGSDTSESDSEANEAIKCDKASKPSMPHASTTSDVNIQAPGRKQQEVSHSLAQRKNRWDVEKQAEPSRETNNEIPISVGTGINRQRNSPQHRADTRTSTYVRSQHASGNTKSEASNEQVPDHHGMSSSELERLMKVLKDDKRTQHKKSKKREKKEKKRKKEKKQKREKREKKKRKKDKRGISDPSSDSS